MSVVRPFPARVVRQDRAAAMVTPMFETLAVTARDRSEQPVDPSAYDEAAPALYVYRQRRGDSEHVGVMCEVHAQAFIDGQVRGHEAVQPGRVEALVQHFATTPERAEPVALLHAAGPVFTATVAALCAEEPLLRFTGPDGLEQGVWQVPEGLATTALAEELSAAVHYIADGHHRVAASLVGWRQDHSPADGALLCVVYPMDGLGLAAFHRRISGPVRAEDLLELLGGFEVEEVADAGSANGCFGIYVEGRWFAVDYSGARAFGPAGLDVSLLHDRLLEPFVTRATEGQEIEIVPVQSSLSELIERCDEDGGALLTLAPPDLGVLTGLADHDEVMPPKTTYFWPKPYAGIFLRSRRDGSTSLLP